MHTLPDDGFGTLAIHAGQEPEPHSGAIMTPIYQTSTFVQDGVARPRNGYEYARMTNPTRTALEANLAALEGGFAARAFGSGLAAMEAVLKATLSAGDRVVAGDNLYGGSERLFRFWERFGIDFEFVDSSDPEALRQGLSTGARLVFLETPTNPLMQLTDLDACATIAHEAGHCWSWTIPSRHHGSSVRSNSAQTSSSIPPPSTWVATATCSAASSSCANPVRC